MGYELIHDTIAKQIFNKASTEAQTRRKVERYITERYQAHQDRKAKLTQDDLDYIGPYLGQVNITKDERTFLEKGKKALLRAKRRRQLLIAGVMAVLAVFLAIALVQWNIANKNKAAAEISAQEANTAKEDAINSARIARENEREAERQKQLADQKADEALAAEARVTAALKEVTQAKNQAEQSFRKAKSESLASRAQLLINEDPTKALRVAEVAYQFADGRPSLTLRKALMEAKSKPVYLPLPHNGTVSSAFFSPDGSKVLTASWDKMIRLWDTKGKLLNTLAGHQDQVLLARFSPDGLYIISASRDGTARLWDANGNMLKVLEGHNAEVTHAVFSPDGKKILTGSRDNTAILWSLTGQKIATLGGHGCTEYGRCGITVALFSPDGSRILTASYGSEARIWDNNGNSLFDLTGHQGPISSAAFSPDGNWIVTGSNDNTAKLWESSTGSEHATIEGHTNNINAVCFTESHIITGSDDGRVGIWNRETEDSQWIKISREIISKVYPTPDRKQFLALSDDHTAYLIDPGTTEITSYLKGHTAPLVSASFDTSDTSGRKILTAARDRTSKIWDLSGLQSGATLVHEPGRMQHCTFSPDDKYFLSTASFTIQWSADGQPIDTMEGSFHAAYSSDGTMILTSSYGGSAALFQNDGTLIKRISNGSVRTYFTPENHLLDEKGQMTTLDGKPITHFTGHESRTNSAVFSRDGTYLVTSSWDETAILWNKDGTLLQKLTGHTDKVSSADISPDNKWILTTSSDQTIKLWDFEGHLINTFGGHGCGDNDTTGGTAGDCGINYGQFSPDGEMFATGGDDGVLILRSLDGTLISMIPGHQRAIIALDFSSKGDKILTAGHDNRVKIWYTPQGIIEWLKSADVYQLSAQDKEKYSIN
jgi:WD40 repeat protein